MTQPELETIQEVASTEEGAIISTSGTKIEDAIPEGVEQNDTMERAPKILALVEETVDELWQDIQKLKEKEEETDTSAPISIVGQRDYMGMEKMSLTTDEGRRVERANPTLWQRYHLS